MVCPPARHVRVPLKKYSLTNKNMDAYKLYDLQDAVNTIPSALRHIVKLDDFISGTVKKLKTSTLAGRRLGKQWLPHASSIIPIQNDDTWITKEQMKPLNDVCTKFCSRKFFPDAISRINFIANVIRIYDHVAKSEGLRYKIIFKGGVMIRVLILQFWYERPSIARTRAFEYFKQHGAVTMSDFDFEIVSTSKTLTCEEKHKFIMISFVVILWIRNKMEQEVNSNTSEMLNTSWDEKHGATELRDMLQNEIKSMTPENPFYGATIDRVIIGEEPSASLRGYKTKDGLSFPRKRRDLFVFECSPHGMCVSDAEAVFNVLNITGLRRKNGDKMYCTCNTYINEGSVKKSPDELRPLFHLSRIKHSFVIYYTTRDGSRKCDRLSGEMLDVSLGDQMDELKQWKYHMIKPERRFTQYPILGVSEKLVDISTFSLEHFWRDHEAMLHMQGTPPWKTPKYEKRLLRYATFFIIHVLSPIVSGKIEHKYSALRQLVRYTNSTPQQNLKTSIPLVNYFARREASAMDGSISGKTYWKTLHMHVSKLVELVLQDDYTTFDSLEVSYLDYMNRHIFPS